MGRKVDLNQVKVPSTLVYVDPNRELEDYIEDGSYIRPYYTLQAAVEKGSRAIFLNPGAYVGGDVAFPSGNVVLYGVGRDSVSLDFSLSTSSGFFSGSGFTLISGNNFDLSNSLSGIFLDHISIAGGLLTVNSGAVVRNCQVSNTNVTCVQVNSGEVELSSCSLTQLGNSSALNHVAGRLSLYGCKITGSAPSGLVSSISDLSSGNGSVLINGGIISNLGGESLQMSNQTPVTSPNTVQNCIIVGSVTLGAAFTKWLGVTTSSSVTGLSIITEPSDYILDKSSVTGGGTLTQALESLKATQGSSTLSNLPDVAFPEGKPYGDPNDILISDGTTGVTFTSANPLISGVIAGTPITSLADVTGTPNDGNILIYSTEGTPGSAWTDPTATIDGRIASASLQDLSGTPSDFLQEDSRDIGFSPVALISVGFVNPENAVDTKNVGTYTESSTNTGSIDVDFDEEVAINSISLYDSAFDGIKGFVITGSDQSNFTGGTTAVLYDSSVSTEKGQNGEESFALSTDTKYQYYRVEVTSTYVGNARITDIEFRKASDQFLFIDDNGTDVANRSLIGTDLRSASILGLSDTPSDYGSSGEVLTTNGSNGFSLLPSVTSLLNLTDVVEFSEEDPYGEANDILISDGSTGVSFTSSSTLIDGRIASASLEDLANTPSSLSVVNLILDESYGSDSGSITGAPVLINGSVSHWSVVNPDFSTGNEPWYDVTYPSLAICRGLSFWREDPASDPDPETIKDFEVFGEVTPGVSGLVSLGTFTYINDDTKQYFFFDNETSYKKYRIKFLSNYGNGSLLGVTHLEMYQERGKFLATTFGSNVIFTSVLSKDILDFDESLAASSVTQFSDFPVGWGDAGDFLITNGSGMAWTDPTATIDGRIAATPITGLSDTATEFGNDLRDLGVTPAIEPNATSFTTNPEYAIEVDALSTVSITTSGNIDVDLGSAQFVNSIIVHDDAGDGIQNFTLQGSSNSDFTGATGLIDDIKLNDPNPETFSIASPNYYRYYRFNIEDTYSGNARITDLAFIRSGKQVITTNDSGTAVIYRPLVDLDLKNLSFAALSDVGITLAGGANKLVRINASNNGLDQTTFTVPTASGTEGEVLTADASGDVVWAAASGGVSNFSGLSDTPSSFNDDGVRTDIFSFSGTPGGVGSGAGVSSTNPFNAFNDNLGNYWDAEDDGSGAYLAFYNITGASSLIISGLSLYTTGTDANIGSFSFYGNETAGISSKTHAGWDLLTTGDNSAIDVTQYFFFDNSTAYQSFKLEFTKTGVVQLSNLELFQKPDNKISLLDSTSDNIIFRSIEDLLDSYIQNSSTYDTTSDISHGDYVVFSNPTSGITLTLPSPVVYPGARYVVKNITTGVSKATLSSSGGNIDGGTVTLYGGDSVVVQSDGSNYKVIAKDYPIKNTTITSDATTLDSKYNLVFANPPSSDITINLPSISSFVDKSLVTIKNISDTYNVTLDPNGNIDGVPTNIVLAPLGVAKLRRSGNFLWNESLPYSGVPDFLGLTDTPSNFSSSEDKFLRVNSAGNAVEFTGSLLTEERTVSSSTATVLSSDHTIFCNTTSTDILVTLPLPSGNAGQEFVIKKVANTYAVTVDVASGGTIDTKTSYVLDLLGSSITVMSNGTEYKIICLNNESPQYGQVRTETVPSGDSSVSVSEADYIVLIDCSNLSTSDTVTVDLSAGQKGRLYVIKKFNSANNNDTSGKLTIDPDGTEFIDGDSTKDINKNNAVEIVFDGDNWWTIRFSGID